MIFGRLMLGWLDDNLDPDEYDAIIANPTEPTRPVRHTELILEAAAKEDWRTSGPSTPTPWRRPLPRPSRVNLGPGGAQNGMLPRSSKE